MIKKLMAIGHFAFILILVVFSYLTICTNFVNAADEKVVIFNGSGGSLEKVQKKVFSEPFTKKTGIKVIHTAPVNFAKLKAMCEAKNPEWDITEIDPAQVDMAVKAGYLEPIDYSIIDKSVLISKFVHTHAIPGGSYATVLAYSTEAFPKPNQPKSWKDFFDVKKFPGRRGLGKDPYFTLEIALLADGVPPEKIYPIDVERALKSLDRIKSHIVWWTMGAQPPQLLINKEVVMSSSYNGRITKIQQEGVPVEIQWNQELVATAMYAVVKGAKHKENAMKYLAFRLTPDRVAEYVTHMPYPPLIKDLDKYITPELAKDLPTNPKYMENAVAINDNWWAENYEKMLEIINTWLLE